MTEEQERLGRIEHEVFVLKTKLDNHLESQNILNESVAELVLLFTEANGAIKFIKVLAAISASLAAVYLFIREVLQHWRL